jgi:hypothetical protein
VGLEGGLEGWMGRVGEDVPKASMASGMVLKAGFLEVVEVPLGCCCCCSEGAIAAVELFGMNAGSRFELEEAMPPNKQASRMVSSSSALYSSRGRGRGIRAKGTVNREGFGDGVEIRSDDQGIVV